MLYVFVTLPLGNVVFMDVKCSSNSRALHLALKSNKETKSYEKANYIKDTGLPSTSHILIYYGLTGQGKTSLLCSLITSKKKGSKVYRGVFDKIYICASYTSMRSIAGDPFKSIPEDQYYETFNESFLRDVTQRVHENALEDMHSLIIIDDAVSRLKRLADPLSNLLLTHRHLKTSVHILAQDVMQVPRRGENQAAKSSRADRDSVSVPNSPSL